MKNLRDHIRTHLFPYLLLAPAFIYLLGFFLLILDRVFVLSLTAVSPQLEEHFPSVATYIAISGSHDFWQALIRTLVFALVGTPLQLVVALFPAMLINRQFAGRGLVRSLFILPLAMPGIVVAIILWIMTNYPFGHINDVLLGKHWFCPAMLSEPINWRGNQIAALSLSMFGKLWHDMPISMLILLAGLQSINREEYEAAETLGAGPWYRFWHITVPHLVPAISTVLVLRSIEMWKEFLFPFILAPRYPLLGTLIEEAYHEWNDPYAAAAISLVLIVCIILFTLTIFMVMKWLRQRLVRI